MLVDTAVVTMKIPTISFKLPKPQKSSNPLRFTVTIGAEHAWFGSRIGVYDNDDESPIQRGVGVLRLAQ
eukprot:scaffold2149_cov172-Amphora_coffeaeformis.AAC.6